MDSRLVIAHLFKEISVPREGRGKVKASGTEHGPVQSLCHELQASSAGEGASQGDWSLETR